MTFDEDHELLARMRAGDPAATLPPAGPERVARLLEGTMEHVTETETTATRTRRAPVAWLAAAAAVAVLGGVGFAATRGSDPATTPVATPEPSVLTLSAPAPVDTRCMVPTPETLANAETAFDGTVTAVDGDQVTLRADAWYAGGPADEVVVTAPQESMQALVGAVALQPGQRYLLAASRGELLACGFSGAYDADRADLYAAAFGG
jgi:hypothetical protein